MKPLKAITFLTILITSCSYSDKDFNLNGDERSFLNAFKAGDTMYYESTTKNIDTILVLGIDSTEKRERGWIMAKPAYKNVWISIKHLPVDSFYGGTFYDSIKEKTDTTFNQVISISKFPQEKKVQYTFMFKRLLSSRDGGLGELHKDTTINSTTISEYYVIDNDWKESQKAPNDLEQLFWTKREGLVAYKYNDGTYWTKKSSR